MTVKIKVHISNASGWHSGDSDVHTLEQTRCSRLQIEDLYQRMRTEMSSILVLTTILELIILSIISLFILPNLVALGGL